MTTSTLMLPVSDELDLASWAAVAFVASYASPGTRQAYATQLRLWFDWCEKHHLEPLADVRRPHVELYARGLEARGLAAATVALKLVVLTGFYRYCVEEQLLEHSPAVHVRRPKVSQESTRLGLDRTELGAFLVQAGLSGGNDHALACLLALNVRRMADRRSGRVRRPGDSPAVAAVGRRARSNVRWPSCVYPPSHVHPSRRRLHLQVHPAPVHARPAQRGHLATPAQLSRHPRAPVRALSRLARSGRHGDLANRACGAAMSARALSHPARSHGSRDFPGW
jgi:hypothetical protein